MNGRKRARLRLEKVQHEWRLVPMAITPIYAYTTEGGWKLFWDLRSDAHLLRAAARGRGLAARGNPHP